MKNLLICFLAIAIKTAEIKACGTSERNIQKRGIEVSGYGSGGSGVYLGHERFIYYPKGHGLGEDLKGSLISVGDYSQGGLISPGSYGYGGISSGTGLVGTGLSGLVGGGTGVGGGNNGQVQISTIIQQVPVAVPQPVPVTVNRAVPVPVAAPYPVTVSRPVLIPFPQLIPVPVIRRVPVIVNRPVPVPQAVPVRVPHPVAVPVLQPVTIQVPVPVLVSSGNVRAGARFGGVAGIREGLLGGITRTTDTAGNGHEFGESGGLALQFDNTGHIPPGSYGKY